MRQYQDSSSRSSNMLAYAKLILSKVSFDAALFQRELHKFIKELSDDDCGLLYKWCTENYQLQYEKIIRSEFRHQSGGFPDLAF